MMTWFVGKGGCVMVGSGSWWGRLGVLVGSVALQAACGETENSGSQGAGGTTSAGGSGTSGGAGSAGAPGDNLPAGCEMLAEKHPDPNCIDYARCEQVKTENEPRAFYLFIADTATDEAGNDVALREQEIAERVDCLERWLEQLGLEPDVHGLDDIVVDATFEEVEPVLGTAVLSAYSVACVDHDCDYCFDHDEKACAADAFCLEYRGQPLDETLECVGEVAFAGCLGHDAYCAQAPSYARDAAGQCWWFSSYCYDLPHLPLDETCGESFTDPPPACL